MKLAGKDMRVKTYPEADLEQVRTFFCSYNDFRTLSACSKETGFSVEYCAELKAVLYRQRRLGGYVFEADAPPQKYMRRWILEKYREINANSCILEVGPGEHPVFPPEEFPRWFAVDKYYEEGVIAFRGLDWARDKYPRGRICRGGWENLGESAAALGVAGACDLLVASHSFEHVTRPIAALIQARQVLRPGGQLVLFVPDGFSDEPAARGEPTHTLYLVPDMVREFFGYADGFADLSVEPFRPNYDLVISATRSGS
jgi:hypothetical protein